MGLKDIQSKITKAVNQTKIFEKIDRLEKLFEDKVKIGIDIGAYSIKVAQVKDTPNGPVVVNLGYKEIIQSADSKTPEVNESLIVDALSILLHEEKIKAHDVRLVISDPAVYSRHITLPHIAKEELAKSVKWQAEKYTPFPIDDAIVDYQTLALNENIDEKQMEVIIVAAERKTINKYLSILKKVKLTPTIVDVTPFAVARALIKNYSIAEDEIVPVIDIGAKRTSVIVVNGSQLQLVRSVDLGGNQLTQAISNGLGCTRAEAEKLKMESSLDAAASLETDEGKFFKASEAFVSELISEIHKSCAYIEREFLSQKINRIFLCGGGSSLKGLAEYLGQKLELPVELANAFAQVNINADIPQEELPQLSSKLMAVIGEIL